MGPVLISKLWLAPGGGSMSGQIDYRGQAPEGMCAYLCLFHRCHPTARPTKRYCVYGVLRISECITSVCLMRFYEQEYFNCVEWLILEEHSLV